MLPGFKCIFLSREGRSAVLYETRMTDTSSLLRADLSLWMLLLAVKPDSKNGEKQNT